MSTKTLRKRIALVAVSALGAGLLSVVAVPSANAAANVAAGTTQTAAVTEGVLNVATKASTSGSAVTTATISSSVPTLAASVGLVNVSDISGGLVAGTTQTAVLLSSGTLVVYTEAQTSAEGQLITVENGTLTIEATAGLAPAVNSTGTAGAVYGAGNNEDTLVAAIKPNAGATTMTVRLYSKTSATSAAAHVISGVPGELVGQITVTIAASSTAGVPAVSKSGIYYSSSSTDGANTADATSGTFLTKSPASQFANIRVRDIYGTAIASTTGLLQASATNGAIINLTDNTGSTGTQSTAFYTSASPDDVMLTVNAPKFMALSTVVTVTYNGTVIGTKSFAFTGPVTQITLGAPLLIKKTGTSGASSQGIGISFADSAGNVIYPASGDTYYPSSSFLTNSGSDRTAVMAQLPTSSQAGYLDWDCDASATTDGLIVDFVNVDGTIGKSNKATVSCAGDAFTYTASYDKASYSPGEVATLTVSFKDSKGNAANDITSWSSGTAPSIAVGGGSLAVATTTSDASSLGKKSYSVTTIVTEGTYQTVVKLTGAVTWSSAQTPQIAGFTLKSTSAGVSNADVLKAIVSLIASINKQIAALQKALLRR
jgi:trimeric autotransporter adhesin